MDVEYRKKMCGGEKDVEKVVAEDILPSIGKGEYLAQFYFPTILNYISLSCCLGIDTNYGIPDTMIFKTGPNLEFQGTICHKIFRTSVFRSPLVAHLFFIFLALYIF